MYLRRIVVVVLVVMALSNVTASLALAQDPDNGKVLWEEQIFQCSRCHGDMAQGLYGRPLSNSTATEAEWIEQVRHPRRSMPAFSEAQITDEQIRDIRAYVTTLPPPADDFRPQDPGTSDNEGHNLFLQKRCVACHDPDVGPLNNFVRRGEEPTAAAVIAQLRHPKNSMPSFSEAQVSDAEATQIADFLAEQYALQAAPATLPTSGADMPAGEMALWFGLAGGLLLAGGLIVRKLFRRATSL